MDKAALRAVLDRNPWFAALPPALAEGILREGRIQHLDGGATIYREGDPANGLYALIEGEIRVIQTTAEGRSALLLVAGAGAWFGESSMLDGKERHSDAIAFGKVAILQLTPAVFARLTRDETAHYACFVQLLGIQYRRAIDYIINTASLPLPVRLAQRLTSFGRGHGRKTAAGLVIDLKLSQTDLANTLGVSRQTLNRQLKKFEAEGLISVGYAELTLRKPAVLERLARAGDPLPI
ncbi:MAG TPA: Crp/Fnr family transcriptional regulator [Parvibaculum sp.]|jgi:CRP-like cAMP-binding protein